MKKEYFQFILFDPKTTRYFVSGLFFPIDDKLEKRIVKKYGEHVQVVKPLESSMQTLEDRY